MLSDAEVDVGYLQVFIMRSKFDCSKNDFFLILSYIAKYKCTIG